MEKRLYLAYGSNLNIRQMKYRCPTAKPIGTAVIRGYELLFKGSKTGAYLTIEPYKPGRVPVAVWEVTAKDEAALDRYEGFPNFYYKANFRLSVKLLNSNSKSIRECFAYIMHEERPIGIPSDCYVHTCLDGYKDFGFDEDVLWAAVSRCEEACNEIE